VSEYTSDAEQGNAEIPSQESDFDFLAAGSPSIPKAPRKTFFRRVILAIVIVVLGVGGYLVLSRSSNLDPAMSQGKVALTETQLKQVVSDRHLVAFWAGPIAGAKYALTVTNAGLVYIRYLPGGAGINDTKGTYRVIGSYPFPKAYDWAVSNGSLPGIIGLNNPDGFAIFYNAASTNNVYMATKGKDVQIEIFDPVANQALGLALVKGQIQQIS